LKKNWRGNKPNANMHVGIRNQWTQTCALVKRSYALLADLLKNTPINAPPTAKNLSVELPGDIQCIVAPTADNRLILRINNFQVLAAGGVDMRESGGALKNLFGTAAVFLRGSYEIAIGRVGWVVLANRLHLSRMHLGINNARKGAIPSWITGRTYSALKSWNTCDSLVTAYAANFMAGKDVRKFMTHNATQWIANRHCCLACKSEPTCEAFAVQQKRGGDGDQMEPVGRRCHLKRVSISSRNHHGNFKGYNTSIGEIDFKGGSRTLGRFEFPSGLSQDNVDIRCAQRCNESPECEMWVTSTNKPNNPSCRLMRASKLDNGIVQRIFKKQVTAQVQAAVGDALDLVMDMLRMIAPWR